MILSSAFASAFLLFGFSFLYGSCGSLYFSEVMKNFTAEPLSVFALGLIIIGFGFKMASVPFHLWAADVYEGAPVPVTAMLSVMSKGAAVFAFTGALYRVFGSTPAVWQPLIVILSASTILIGNLFAIRQQNIKRFLAFSSITQAGYLLLSLASASNTGNSSIVYFMLMYVFSNIGAFTIAGIISDKTGKEKISDYNGLYRSNPLLAVVMLLALFSLAGIPPTAGFFGKFFLLTAAVKGSPWLFFAVIFAALNMVISLYYYLRIVKAMFVDATDSPMEKIKTSGVMNTAIILCTAGILSAGFAGKIFDYLDQMSFGLK